ncbi:hypothetical protein EP331_07435 [bacterium]|nr:MAG: hypothetical protein EP331_07435 [bacterium]
MKFKLSYRTKRKFASLSSEIQDRFRTWRLKYHFFQSDLYDFSLSANKWVRTGSFTVLLLALITVVLPILLVGVYDVDHLLNWLEPIVLLSFGGLFFFRVVIEPNRFDFIRSRKFEAVAAIFAFILGWEIVLDGGIISYIWLEHLGLDHPKHSILLSVQYYLVFLIVIKVVQQVPKIIAQNSNPARLILSSFGLFILMGAALLMLPVSTPDLKGLPFVDALFMSASAVCVTGLAVVDTATQLSLFGQITILLLIQIGGIGVITFATFLAIYLSDQLGLNHRHILQEVISSEDVRAVSKTLRLIVIVTFIIESIGAIIYFLTWTDLIPGVEKRLFFSVFHSVSAFCNAGFSLFSNSLADPVNALSWSINLTTIILIVLGGLGFTTIAEILMKLRPYENRKWRFSVYSKIVLKMTAILITFGTVFILITEWNGVLEGYNTSEKFLMALFQSVTTRTAGFNSVDISALSLGTTLIFLILMSIGGAPSSTAGGIKTTTMYVLFASMITNIQGKERLEIANRTIPNIVIFRAISTLFLAIITSLISLVIMSLYEPFSLTDLLFEQVSAFMTVGLSRGITAELGSVGKLVLVFSMFVGRVGLLTFAVAFANKAKHQNYLYPEENIPVA